MPDVLLLDEGRLSDASLAANVAVKASPARVAKPATMPLGVPESIGNYRLLDRLGEGGMGTVYLAEQRSPYRKVALKIIRSGLDGKQILSRFEAERQALALMQHTNVTTVLDSGLASYGRPYFVMEYVQGQDITSIAVLFALQPIPSSEPFTAHFNDSVD